MTKPTTKPAISRSRSRQPASATTSAPAPAPALTPAIPAPPTKTALVRKLLTRARGATVAEIAEPTGWQPHSVRSYLTGLRRKGNPVVRDAQGR